MKLVEINEKIAFLQKAEFTVKKLFLNKNPISLPAQLFKCCSTIFSNNFFAFIQMAELNLFPFRRFDWVDKCFSCFSSVKYFPPLLVSKLGKKTPMDRQRKHWITWAWGFAVLHGPKRGRHDWRILGGTLTLGKGNNCCWTWWGKGRGLQ